ncbi:MAG: hypothetical protein IJP07_04835 [Firmicutes bacterium]|nr:hypothetical protein [Bacillota bacterium]
MARINLPYQFRDGNRAYAAQIMADLNALAGGLNNISISGMPEGDLEAVLQKLKTLTDGKISANQAGNAAQIKFSDGESMQDKLDSGALKGADAVLSTSDGMYCFYVGADGHLYLLSRSEVQGEAFHIDENGHLIYSLGEPGEGSGETKLYDLGYVRGPKGDSGDMQLSVYDPQGKQRDIYAYVDEAMGESSKSGAKSCFVYAAGWDSSTKRNRVSLEGLTAEDHFLVCHSSFATEEQRNAWREGCIFLQSQEEGSFVLQADQTLPTVDIPLTVLLLP